MSKQCTLCEHTKPADQFRSNSHNKDGLHSHCKDCTLRYGREYYQKRKLHGPGQALSHKTCSVCKERKKINAFTPRFGCGGGVSAQCKQCTNVAAKRAYKIKRKDPTYRARIRAKAKRGRNKLREEVFDAYGRFCQCCNESHSQFLCIDHINGDGAAHRKSLKRTGTLFYQWLRTEGFPPEFRTLCYNCNMAFGIYGVCPHSL